MNHIIARRIHIRGHVKFVPIPNAHNFNGVVAKTSSFRWAPWTYSFCDQAEPCDVLGFSTNNNWILMSRQSRPQAQKRNRIQHEFDRDSGAPLSRQHETWRSRTRLFFYDEHLKMTVSHREITEKHISNTVKSEEGNTTAQICSRNQWLCERDGNSRVHCVICRSVGLRRTTRHQFTSMSFPLRNGALT